MDINLDKLIEFYMNGSDELYSIDTVDFMAQILIEAQGIAGTIVKDGMEYEGICNFNKRDQSVEIEREQDGIVTVQMPFTIKM